MKTLGIVCNFWNEANALPGWLEMAASFFDEVVALQSGPQGQESTDGSIEILEKWRIPIHRTKIDEGFGIVRTAAVRACKTDYVMLLDCDERFYQWAQVMSCSGESTPADEVNQILQQYDCREQGAVPSNWENIHLLGAKLTVSYGEVYNQGAWLKDMIQHGDLDGVQTFRRHWHDFSFKRPTQNWNQHPDAQLRIVRNHESIFWDANTKMHERLIGASNVMPANLTHGPWFDHAHFWFKGMAKQDRRFKLNVYDAIHEGRTPEKLA